MEKFLIPLSFKKRRAPLLAKVIDDGERMYQHALYAIVLDELGFVKEARVNPSTDNSVLDCLVVLAPVSYRKTMIERAVVLEIGFRRFVPYAVTEYRKNGAPVKRGPRVRGKNRAVTPQPKKKKERPAKVSVPVRIPITRLSEDALFDLMPDITKGIQACVDSIALTWDKTLGTRIRWAQGGNKMTGIFWMKHEMAPSLSVRIPKKERLLCATASFAEFEWRKRPGNHLEKSANAIKDMLKSFLRPRRRLGKVLNGGFEDDFIKSSETCHWVAERLKSRVERGYTPAMAQAMLDFVGHKGTIARNLVEQIWRVHKVPRPKPDREFARFEAKYGGMKDLLLDRWLVENYRNLRLERIRKDPVVRDPLTGTERPKKYFHASNSCVFTVFVSKDGQAKMIENYCARRVQENQNLDTIQPIRTLPKISTTEPSDFDDSNISWDNESGIKTSVHDPRDDDIPF